MKNMSDFIYRAAALAVATVTSASVSASGATAVSSSATTTSAAAAAAASNLRASGVGVTWGNEHFYDEVDVYFAAAYINDSWVTISNSHINGSKNTRDDNVSSLLSYGSINQLTFMNNTGVEKGNNGDNGTNTTITNMHDDEMVTLIQMLALSIVLGLMILITIIGNVFVIAAIMLERNLQNVANYLVASLAVADLFVACLVMPLGAVMEISQGWILGPELCDIWTCCDVLCCTASILHLVAIASDRYWTVTNIDYTNFRTPQRVFLMIFCVWIASFLVSLAPQFGWKDPEYMERIKNQKCMVSQDVGYQIFATCSTFYVPLFVILVLYWKIYKIARKRIQRRTNRPHLNALQANNTNHQTKSRKQKNKEKQQLKQQIRQQQQELQLQQEQIKQQQQLQLQQEQLEEEQSEIVAEIQNKQEQKSKRQKRLKICFGGGKGSIIQTQIQQQETEQQQQQQHQKQQRQQQQEQQQQEQTPRNGVTISATTTTIGVGGGINDKPLTALSVCNTLAVGTGGEETEFSTSNFDSKSHGTEVTTISSDAEEPQTPQSTSEINTISHQVILPQHKHAAKDAADGNTLAVPSTLSGTQNISVASAPNSGDGTTTNNKLLTSIPNPLQKLVKRRQLLEARRERKAAQTLAIITGAFVVCWLPFFVMAILLPLCKSCDINPTVASVFLWLGYFNSTLNPIIYTVFNPEFRRAFQRIVFGRQTLPHAVASRKM